ncbi:hypothetical protein [Rhodococcus sp. BS-15]|uniref:hypothetical protein n=1 Tax=Rhodococcus sp. BS-15 TaxID=1304954 RepID=UPI000A614314|nr:hypothetical protein [Rhodococcus sp. BS-15]
MTAILDDAAAEQLAESLARQHHAGQVDRSGVPYIEHVEAVARAPFLPASRHRQVAWLHDIVEDTDITLTDLTAAGFSPVVVHAVGLLTHTAGQPRRGYIAAIAADPVARLVKQADNRHNLSRNSDLTDEQTRKRLYEKYTREWGWLHEESAESVGDL